MPNQPKTPLIAVRVPGVQQDQLKRIAAAEGVTVSDLVREGIESVIASRQGV